MPPSRMCSPGWSDRAECVRDCFMTADFTSVEADGLEHKYLALGIGLILEFDPESEGRL